MDASPAVSVSQLVVERGGTVVLPGISFRIEPGTVTGLLGPSGCGKSTLLRSVVGVQQVQGGAIDVLGTPAGSASLRARVGYVTQAASVYGDLTVRENLAFFASVLDVSGARIDEVLELVDLGGHAERLAGELSGGQRSRASLAVALLGSPDLLVLDEPTVGLDPVLRESLWSTFASLAEQGATLIVSSHVMDEASRCDRLLLMYDGRLVADDTPAAVLAETGSADLDAAFLAIIRAQQVEASR
jgi:ABC-2 type transport system ATP-binding protein